MRSSGGTSAAFGGAGVWRTSPGSISNRSSLMEEVCGGGGGGLEPHKFLCHSPVDNILFSESACVKPKA